MQKLKIYQADAFTDKIFGGNPAALVPLKNFFLPDALMQSIAAENNLAETAFIIPTEKGFHLRWFTPSIEVRLCGHATLATAHILYDQLGYDKPEIIFETLSGDLRVKKTDVGYEMDFPADFSVPENDVTDLICQVLGFTPLEIRRGKDDVMAVVSSEKQVENLLPNFALLKHLNARGIIVTAKGDDVDFVSRCFFPEVGIEEDPVTGSAHTVMTPYWSEKLNKTVLKAVQISKRRGHLTCTLAGDRVLLAGNAVTYLKGEIFV